MNVTVNHRSYTLPANPIAVICLDGCADEYLSVAIARGKMPRRDLRHRTHAHTMGRTGPYAPRAAGSTTIQTVLLAISRSSDPSDARHH